jgi:hypothetical protein
MARTEVAVDDTLLAFLERLARFGQDNDARGSARPRRMLNITCDTGRLPTGGRVVTLEVDPGKIGLARANLAAAGLDRIVDVVEGRAADTLGELPGPFDIVFLDADRES